MKDKRNCNNNMNYPVYPGFQNFGGPMMVPPMGYPNAGFGTMQNYGGVTEQQINNLSEQVNQLEQRITRLERQYMNNNNNYNNKYNDSNYYMV